jgi:Predicted nucleic acid-binding protein, contains PIN domain
MKYFLDTNICIYILKGMYPSVFNKLVSHNPSEIKIPAIVKAELIYGAEKSVKQEKNLEMIKNFLLPFEIVPFEDTASVWYGKTRASLEKNGTPIGPNDLIIAATVLDKQGVFVTNNVKEFSRINQLNIENWVESKEMSHNV